MANNKRVLIGVAALLVVILAGGMIAYRTLASKQEAPAPAAAPAATTSAASTTSSDAASTAAETSSSTGTSSSDSAESSPMLADYDATVYTESGDATTLIQIANGKPLVLNFWATWCPYCVQEMGDYQQLFQRYGEKVSFAFLDCNYGGRGETGEKARAYLDENGYGDLPLYLDTNMEASANFGASSLPTTIVVAADGTIVYAAAGAINASQMDGLLSSLVS